MRNPFLVTLLSGLVAAQSVDLFGIIASYTPAPMPTFAVGLSSQIIPYYPTSAASSVFSSITASGPSIPTSTGTVGSGFAGMRRDMKSALMANMNRFINNASVFKSEAIEQYDKRNAANGNCVTQPIGLEQMPTPDSPSAFSTWHHYHLRAHNQSFYQPPDKSSYIRTQTGYNASNIAIGYLGFQYLPLYRPNQCAQICDNTTGCSAFNIYFERDPTVAPAPRCPNPPSSTTVKCVLFGVALMPSTAINVGQWREQFQVFIAGSNSYLRTDGCTNPPLPGYSQPVYLGNATIASQPDCNGQDAFLGYQFFNTGPFDYNLCAAACSATSVYLNSTSSRKQKQCTFFSTFVLNLNGFPIGQVCNLYSRYLENNYATNTGGFEYGYPYTITQSYTSFNLTNPGKSSPKCPGQSTPTPNAICSAFVKPTALNLASLSAAASAAMKTQTGDYGYG